MTKDSHTFREVQYQRSLPIGKLHLTIGVVGVAGAIVTAARTGQMWPGLLLVGVFSLVLGLAMMRRLTITVAPDCLRVRLLLVCRSIHPSSIAAVKHVPLIQGIERVPMMLGAGGERMLRLGREWYNFEGRSMVMVRLRNDKEIYIGLKDPGEFEAVVERCRGLERPP